MVLQPLTLHSWSLRTPCGLTLSACLFLASEPKGLSSTQSLPLSDQDVRQLGPGMPLERDLVGGQSHRYKTALNTGQYLHVVVDQRGIDVIVVLRGPDGGQLMEIDGMNGPLGAEELVWETSNMGTYSLEVRARAAQARKGLYEVTLQQSVEVGSQQRARIEAQQLYMEGRRAQQSGVEGMEQAEKKYEEALAKWREASVPRWEGMTLTNLAIVCRTLSRPEKALDC